jgi:thioesterase domain-containing protein
MSPIELEKYLHDHIPFSKAMQVAVVRAQPETVILSAPLAPNINHRDTVFGGSASAVAILAAWSLLHTRLTAEGITSRLVIQRNTMSYELPIDGTFTAEAVSASTEGWRQFLRTLRRRSKARITVNCALHFAGQIAGRLEGEFVALGAIGIQSGSQPDTAR